MILEIEQYYKNKVLTLKISYIGSNGRVCYMEREVEQPYKWVLCKSKNDKSKDKDFLNWDGRHVKREVSQYLSKFELMDYILTMSERDRALLLEFNFPVLCSIDIETEIGVDFPNPLKSEQCINAMSFCWKVEEYGKRPKLNVLSLGLKSLSPNEIRDSKTFIRDYIGKSKFGSQYDIEWVYVRKDSEVELLKFFIEKVLIKFSVITGWHFINFDWTYIINRIERLNDEIGANLDLSKASVSGKMNYIKKDSNIGFPKHIFGFDYLDYYIKYDRQVKFKESNRLDYVAEQAVGLKKLKYNGSLQELYETDFKTFINYNAIDSLLVLLIHEKLQTVNPIFMLANQNLLPIGKSSSNVALTETLLHAEFYRNGFVVADKKLDKERKSYEGAYVMQPISGIYFDVACYDFASLYPSIMRQYNVSPESYIEKLDLDSKNLSMIAKIERYEKDSNYTITPSGAVFKMDKDSILKTILTSLYNQRKVYKKRMMEINEFLAKYGIY